MSENKSKNPSIQTIITVGYLLTITLAHFHLHAFYSEFNIEIGDFLNPIEYILPFLPLFSSLVILILTFIGWIAGVAILSGIHEHSNKIKVKTGKDEKREVKSYPLIEKIALILENLIFYLFPISFIVGIFLNEVYLERLIIADTLIFLLAMIFAALVQKHYLTDFSSRVRYGSGLALIIVVFLSVSYVEASRKVDSIKNKGRHLDELTFQSINTSISTNDSLFYLGQSQEYIFFYYAKSKTSRVINKQTGTEIRIKN